ncbi:efflux RND transporter periplasmic adaptor subunit [Pseudoduganella chitinolytica]|uniref:Efflux RND transporter periplasmic adaptor subunit n=1 Tax=Pseudoduganella chitinolytica TaxID=34070 RepID=A0ABY8BF45_9BURK|nr:efflux RND transporter periplasmic adaptor subunit [Pseudoduganella chitinolytica]WEF34520.1 efflux RND transporter periplasmic adaptor subunit [Pseudoduganella chitinolytica]
MTATQKKWIALLCAIAAALALALWWRSPAEAPQEGHAGHADSHGHDDRHAEAPAAEDDEDGTIAMTEAQVRANGIGIDAARPAAIQERLHLPAQVKADADRTVAVAAPAPGIVQTVLVSPGAQVRKGQPLVVLQSAEVAQWRADAASARQRMLLADSVYQRERKLWDEQISARQDLEAAQSALREARIGAQAAQQRLAALGVDGGGARLATVTLRAPLAGIVIERPAVAGQAIDGRIALLTIADLAHVWIEAAVASGDLGQVTQGMPATVTAAALPGEVAGTVSYVGPVLGEATRMATARVTLANPALRLRPGMLASVDLLGQAAAAPVTVASDAIQTIHERTVVFVRTPAGFRATPVQVGRSDGKRSEIVKGLAAGARYAAAGSYLLKADLGKSEAEHDH